ncbi:type I restriction enzyme M protein [Halarchaeum solikamskense]|uniref:N-6 DNA methylase n=1 Tax=Halarchaeum nitratireducens TaxID=489913 RepID=UPI001B3AB456|nr:N-6 DNA methylase [Halarchaeum solikamskense]MBP2251276.1 type I restriction enzyme M protein [Halarchaeum solikamskense]
MSEDDNLHLDPIVEKAEDRGYLEVDKDKERIEYHCGDPHEEDYVKEEKVRAVTYSWLIIEMEYAAECIGVEFSVPDRVPTKFADIVVFDSEDMTEPYIAVENKSRDTSDADYDQAIEQGYGYANSLGAEYLLVDKGDQSVVYKVSGFGGMEREENRLGSKDKLPVGYDQEPEWELIAGEENDISPSPVEELEKKIRRTHAEIWSGGKRDPLTSFDEWSKLLFAKVYDEGLKDGEPRMFQRGVGMSDSRVANNVHDLFEDAKEEHPTVFEDGATIELPAEKVADIVDILQEESITSHDLDGIGRAFEEFFGQIFRGQLGQYFTRRELTRYMVSTVDPDTTDFVLDPTVGSGGFLIETYYQLHNEIMSGSGSERQKVEQSVNFAQNHLYGVEIHEKLSRIAKVNMILHKVSPKNIEGDRSCLDTQFDRDRLNGENFDVVVGNPPFGDSVEAGDRDRLGSNKLERFDLKKGSKIKTEIAVIERGIEFLKPGGTLAFVVPDGLLNNYSERSNCPQLRRHLIRNGKITGVTSLPEHTFTKAGAQNKTSILFFEKYTEEEKEEFDETFRQVLDEKEIDDFDDLTGSEKWDVMADVVTENDYPVFLAEAEEIGYAPTGESVERNDLYTPDEDGYPDLNTEDNILAQYHKFCDDPEGYEGGDDPETMSIMASEMFSRRDDGRIDPKYHLFQRKAQEDAPDGTKKLRLGDALEERDERVDPTNHPDTEFTVPTVTHDGDMTKREAGKGKNPVAWEGQYFTGSSRWHYMYEGDIVYSQIDLWKGAISTVGEDFDGAISTTEFPIYKVEDEDKLDPHYLKLLLRSEYFQNAIRAIVTGHSNRRRTQQDDFEDLEIFIPEIGEQRQIAAEFAQRQEQIEKAEEELDDLRSQLDKAVTGELPLDEIIEEETDEETPVEAELAEMDDD